ncbi:hypothetical protein [Snodgrassella alvi]|uniref:hypothetical protein n=1 Tax=Snodgrassella alvi TaxID=1196083 RepID=UPI000C1E4673|nr:hypothetical protein [Snodgrassella alvi]PIT15386.1 hypothetical protein BGI33_06215 [Snodgrassella alvi]PIT16942.1 hypothetical protein BGI34_09095 [Snodgrassella alvi]
MNNSENKRELLYSKRELLYRKAQGKIHKDNYFNKIRSFTNVDVNANRFLSLEETDVLINKINCKNLLWREKKYDCCYKELVDFIQSKVKKQPFYLLIDEEWKYCGAYKVINDISEEYDFDKLVSDEIRIIPYDLSFQIRIDYDFNEIECEYIIYK